jgi:hypothetical protein
LASGASDIRFLVSCLSSLFLFHVITIQICIAVLTLDFVLGESEMRTAELDSKQLVIL